MTLFEWSPPPPLDGGCHTTPLGVVILHPKNISSPPVGLPIPSFGEGPQMGGKTLPPPPVGVKPPKGEFVPKGAPGKMFLSTKKKEGSHL